MAGLGPSAAVVTLLDGSRDRTAIIDAARAGRCPGRGGRPGARPLLARARWTTSRRGCTPRCPGPARRLAPELATASLAYGDSDGGARTLARRRGRLRPGARGGPDRRGRGQLPGRLRRRADRDLQPTPSRRARRPHARRADPGRSGSAPAGRRRPGRRARPRPRPGPATTARCAGPGRSSPGALPGPDRGAGPRPGAAPGGLPPARPSGGRPAGPARASACLRCLDLRKAERDPAWPLILAQPAGAPPAAAGVRRRAGRHGRRAGPPQALAFIDRGPGTPGDQRHAGTRPPGLAVAAPDLAAAPGEPGAAPGERVRPRQSMRDN